jgi:hypothetical protein
MNDLNMHISPETSALLLKLGGCQKSGKRLAAFCIRSEAHVLISLMF